MNYQPQQQASLAETFNKYKASFARYWRLAWPPALAVTLLALFLAYKLPDYYTSSFIVRIQAQQIEANVLGKSEIRDDTTVLSSLVEELKARPKLLKIIQEFDLYPHLKGLSGQEKALDKFQKAYDITPLETTLGRSSENATSMIFRVSFSHSNRNKVFQVADKLEHLFLTESLINIRSETRATEEFLNSQLKTAQRKLEDIEKKREEYLRKHGGRLPDSREKAVTERKMLMDKIFLNNQTIDANQGRIRYLNNELEMTKRDPSTAGSSSLATGVDLDAGASLAQLKQALSLLRGRYSEKYPDVVALKNRIEQLEGRIKRGEVPSGNKSTGINLGNTRESRMITREINEIEVQTNRLQSENAGLKAQIDELSKAINSYPVEETELAAIERDYATQKDLYEDLTIRLAQAHIKGDLISSQRGPRFIVIDPPTKPEIPSGPPRILIALGGIAAGIAVLFLIPSAFYFFNSSFKFKREAEAALTVPVIGLIPPIKTPTVLAQQKSSFATSLGTSVFTLIAGILALFFTI